MIRAHDAVCVDYQLNRQLAGCADQRGRGPLSLDIPTCQILRIYLSKLASCDCSIGTQSFSPFRLSRSSDPLKGNGALARVLHRGIDDPQLQQLNNAGAGVYVTINETALKGRRTADNIRRVRTIFQEDDHAYTGQFPIEPSVVVESSPGHFHRYWLIAGEWAADEAGQ